jgi:bacillithiol system protein YtxJ
MIRDCDSVTGFERLLDESHEAPILVLKHSTRCPISARAQQAYQRFAETATAPCCRVLVLEQRDVSDAVAARLQLPHQSPQAFVLHKGKVVWQASHFAITEEALAGALANISK